MHNLLNPKSVDKKKEQEHRQQIEQIQPIQEQKQVNTTRN